jgi:DNA-binding protein HU-beta
MTPKDLIEAIAANTGYPRVQVRAILTAEAKLLGHKLQNEIECRSLLGTFKVVEMQERTGKNPKTGEPMNIPARKVIRFNAGKTMKGEVVEAQEEA